MHRTELDRAFLAWVGSPGEHLSVLDNISDLEECRARVAANATTSITTPKFLFRDGSVTLDYSALALENESVRAQGMFCTVYLGDRNNPYFPWFAPEVMEHYPDACMRDARGAPIALVDPAIRGGKPVPVPAIDDPSLTEMSRASIREGVAIFGANPWVTAWVIGSEESYPEYFGLPQADFRSASLAHFRQWQRMAGWPAALEPDALQSQALTADRSAWLHFRERAMADRAAWYMLAFLASDRSRPVFYPTHGHPFSLDKRWRLGQPAGLMAANADGLELGHITFDDDDEKLNMLCLTHFSAHGSPLIVPRLGNKALDPSAKGGGRSFTPVMLRRLVYECLGMGAWHIGPIHWRSLLHDGEWFIKGTPCEAECGRVFREIGRARPFLQGMARLQPSVGLYVADDSWLEAWNPRWTGFIHDCLSAHWNVSVAGDAQLDAGFAGRTPLLISIDNPRVSEEAFQGLLRYVQAGGTLLVWGDFARLDERTGTRLPGSRDALLTLPSVRVLDDLPGPRRTLVYEYLSATGSHKAPQVFAAAPCSALMAAASGMGLGSVIGPAPAAVTVLPLTDGVSHIFVLINTEASPVDFVLSPDASLLSSGRAWAFHELEAGKDLPGRERCRVALAANATSLVWAHPVVAAGDVRAAVASALEVHARWKAAGCDTGSIDKAAATLRQRTPAVLKGQKAWCLAQVILSSLCPIMRAAQDAGGALSATVSLLDAHQHAASAARVSLRFISDRFRRRPLEETGDGTYSLRIAADDLPVHYDMQKGVYTRTTGAVRVVLDARTADGRAGGAVSVVELR